MKNETRDATEDFANELMKNDVPNNIFFNWRNALLFLSLLIIIVSIIVYSQFHFYKHNEQEQKDSVKHQIIEIIKRKTLEILSYATQKLVKVFKDHKSIILFIVSILVTVLISWIKKYLERNKIK